MTRAARLTVRSGGRFFSLPRAAFAQACLLGAQDVNPTRALQAAWTEVPAPSALRPAGLFAPEDTVPDGTLIDLDRAELSAAWWLEQARRWTVV